MSLILIGSPILSPNEAVEYFVECIEWKGIIMLPFTKISIVLKNLCLSREHYIAKIRLIRLIRFQATDIVMYPYIRTKGC